MSAPTQPATPSQGSQRLFSRGSWRETVRVGDILRKEAIGGALLLLAAVIALVWANSPWAEGYVQLRDTRVGPAALHLDLTLATWAADGLLAVFFFVAALELKREFVDGDLRDPRRAAIPIAAALGGVTAPALIYTLVNLGGDGDTSGWAIPTLRPGCSLASRRPIWTPTSAGSTSSPCPCWPGSASPSAC